MVKIGYRIVDEHVRSGGEGPGEGDDGCLVQ